MSVPRAELVSSAISFLQDPAVANASLEQRLGFLRSKGLSDAEVAEAMRYAAPAAGTSGSQALQMPAHAQHAYANPYAPDPRLARDWRDWFIMAVVAGSVGYGIVGLARVSDSGLACAACRARAADG
jgi:peroxin-14